MCGACREVSPGLCCPVGAQAGRGGEAQAPLPRSGSLCVSVAVTGEGLADGALALSPAQVPCKALGVARPEPRGHSILPFSPGLGSSSFSYRFSPTCTPLARCLCLPHPPDPIPHPVLSVPALSLGEFSSLSTGMEQPLSGPGLGAGLVAGDNALSLGKATEATTRVHGASPGSVWAGQPLRVCLAGLRGIHQQPEDALSALRRGTREPFPSKATSSKNFDG